MCDNPLGIIAKNIKYLPANPEIKKLLPELCQYLSGRLPELWKIYVYGSQARGDWHEDSDTDLLFIIDEDIESRYLDSDSSRFCRVTDAVLNFIHIHNDNEYICLLSPITFTKDVDAASAKDGINPALINNIRRDGVLIYARDSTL